MSMDADDSDVDIVLEEVSKIFRCKDCLRCYISYTKFTEHFPVYHPDKVATITDDPSSKSKTSLTSLHRNVKEGRVIDTSGESQSQVISERQKMLLTRKRLEFAVDNSSRTFYSTNSKRKGSGEHFKFESSAETSTNQVCAVRNQDNENGTAERKIYVGKRSNHHKLPENEVNDSQYNLPLQLPTGDNNSKNVEVITLSDSDDDDNENTSYTGNGPCKQIVLKQEFDGDQETNNIKQHLGRKNGAKDINDERNLSPDPKKEYLCQYCNKVFTRDRTLMSHVNTIHKAEIEFEKLHAQLQQRNETSISDKEMDIGLKDMEQSVNPQLDKDRKMLKNGSKQRNLSRRKRQVRKKKPEAASVNDEDNKSAGLTFSCKWCPDRFFLLEDLKKHAINIHIKYKMLD